MSETPRHFIDNAPLVLASRQVMGLDRLPVTFAFHLKPQDDCDSGWVFWSGLEDQEFVSDNTNTVVAPLKAFLNIDPTLLELLKCPIGTAWERDSVGGPWREVPGYLDEP